MMPAKRGPLSAGEITRRPPVDPGQLLAIYTALHDIISARTTPLPDVWGASEPADDGTPLGFDGMPTYEIVDRLIAWKLGVARATGWRRVQALVNEARTQPPS